MCSIVNSVLSSPLTLFYLYLLGEWICSLFLCEFILSPLSECVEHPTWHSTENLGVDINSEMWGRVTFFFKAIFKMSPEGGIGCFPSWRTVMKGMLSSRPQNRERHDILVLAYKWELCNSYLVQSEEPHVLFSGKQNQWLPSCHTQCWNNYVV